MPRFGLGAALLVGGEGLPYSIYVPIMVRPRVRLEPEIAVQKTTQEGPGDFGTLRLQAGLGLFQLSGLRQGTLVYGGVRAGVAYLEDTFTDPFGGGKQTAHHTDWFVRVAAGGEHLIAGRFSLGAEARLTWYRAGTPSTGSSGFFPAFPAAFSSIGTGAAGFVRWYFAQ